MTDLRTHLSWLILELKYMYYIDDYKSSDYAITDADFDAIEKEYVRLCDEAFEVPTAASHGGHIGCSTSRPCVQLVHDKLTSMDRRTLTQYLKLKVEHTLDQIAFGFGL